MTDLELLEIWAEPQLWHPVTRMYTAWGKLTQKQRERCIDLVCEIETIFGLTPKITDSKDKEGFSQRARILAIGKKLFK